MKLVLPARSHGADPGSLLRGGSEPRVLGSVRHHPGSRRAEGRRCRRRRALGKI